jgi:hypothetical protein
MPLSVSEIWTLAAFSLAAVAVGTLSLAVY